MEGKNGAGWCRWREREACKNVNTLIILFIQIVLDSGKVVRFDFRLLGNKILNIFISKLLFPDWIWFSSGTAAEGRWGLLRYDGWCVGTSPMFCYWSFRQTPNFAAILHQIEHLCSSSQDTSIYPTLLHLASTTPNGYWHYSARHFFQTLALAGSLPCRQPTPIPSPTIEKI